MRPPTSAPPPSPVKIQLVPYGRKAFDLYTHQPLGPEHLLAFHTEGDPSFAAMARGYPERFADVNLGRWAEA